MSYNISKCKLFPQLKKVIPSRFTYTMTDEPFELVFSHPNLCVILASDLRSSEHCKNISNSATQVFYTEQYTHYPCAPAIKKIAYTTIVRPTLEYSSPW